MYKTISIGLIMIILAGYFLFAMKREVEVLNFEIRNLTKQINHEKDTINLLKAEFCHLTSPSRLSRLSKQYLDLANVPPERMIIDPLKAEIAQKSNDIQVAIVTPKTVRWRYKPSPLQNKYIRHASLNVSAR